MVAVFPLARPAFHVRPSPMFRRTTIVYNILLDAVDVKRRLDATVLVVPVDDTLDVGTVGLRQAT